jgi:hypothetical protein
LSYSDQAQTIPARAQFLKAFVATQVSHGLSYRNPNSACCSAALVPKPGQAKFRFTVDLKHVNRVMIAHSWPMPHLDSELSQTSGSTVISKFYFSNGYWQLPLHVDSQECITACVVMTTLVLLFIGTVRPEPFEIHSGKLTSCHMDLACQLGL